MSEFVPEHGHITVDEESYWSLFYIFDQLDRGHPVAPTDPLVTMARQRLDDARRWNEIDPLHHLPDVYRSIG